ncbi:MAG: hypothetical protein K0R28_1795 [Paenibacillus sp.]|nr:hypothetical protein [Paenibacillus sp.]
MLRLVRRSVALMLVFLLLFGLMLEITSAWAAEATEPDVTVLQNDFIKITVDNGTGRFGIRTVEGQPIRKNDQNVNMLFKGDDPETSFTTFRIDGTDYIFGNPYKFAADFFSEITRPRVVENSNGTKQIETVWSIKGVDIKQILMLYMDGADKLNAGNVNIRYEVVNRSGVEVKLGTRILLDTMVGANDGPQFQIGTAFRAPLLVERKLVHDPENDPAISEEDRPLYKLPSYWVMRDKNDLTNPQATNVIAYGLNNFAEANINIVDEMIVGHWNGMANTKWDYTPNGNLDFTRDTNDFGTADSAVAFYWQPKALTQGMSQSFETVYGLGELIEPDKVFSLRFMDTPLQLGTLPDNSAYENEGLFDIAVEIENLASYGMEHSYITSELSLQSGLSFVKLDEKGQIVRDKNGKVETESYRSKQLEIRKPATPQEAELGIQPTFKPGDTVAVTYKVQAQGKPWPTNKQYMLTARSPETEQKVEGVQDESIKAQYESNKSNFIVLPPVGQAVPTYVYSLSPKELYDSDIKYITANVTNIDAYNTGNETTNPNFDLYIKEKVTGKRYKVPVKTSVVLQPTDDGFTGDMRVSYRGGDEVDAKGNVIKAGLGPELPLGEYQLEIDYKGDTGGDAEIAAMYDITTKQTFKVTDNAATRIREANILAVYKQYVDLSHVTPSVSGELLEKINKAFPGEPFKSGTNLYDMMSVYKNAKAAVSSASKLADPRFKTDEFMDAKNDKAVPAYNYKLFDSEQELAEFFKDNNPNDNIKEREQLVVIRGMVKQIGTGAEQTVVVDTKTEPAIINSAVAYKGKDIVFVRGKLDVFGLGQQLNVPFLDTLFIKGEGSLSVANSGFEFYRGEWTLDFFNGFDKKLGEKLLDSNIFPASQDNEEDSSLNGSLTWAVGTIGDRLNPMRQLMIEHVYFNKHSLFAAPSFSVAGFGLQFNDYILRPGGISFGGRLSMKIVEAEARNVIFNDKGFVGIDASLKFNLDKDLGLIGKGNGASGRIDITHYVQHVDNVANRYGIQFNAELKNIASIQAELSFKQVPDGRVLPDVIGFGTTLPKPGIPIAAATSLTAVRGAVRELADTIAGSSKDPFPLVLQAGVTLRFGITPAYHFGKIDLTLKRTGIALRGKLDFSTKDWPDDDDLIPMITKALLEAQWATPWFIRLEAEADVLGWGVVIGKAGIFVGQNLEKNRIDFEGYLGARVQIPNDVPVVGGLPLASVFFGVNNDKVWGSIEILLIKLGITYYWGGGVEFGTSDQQLPDGLVHLLVDDPDRGPRLLVIGQGMQTMATSWIDAEKDRQDITYRSVGDGMKIIDNGTMSVGLGGIAVKNGGRIHEIPMGGVSGNAIIEMEYTDPVMPQFSLKDAQGNVYPVIFDNTNTNPQANAWTQHIKSTESVDKVDHRKAYIIVPQERLSGGTWTLTALSGVETRLLNVPVLPELKSAALAKNHTDANKFTASWTIDNAKPGDKINLYLAKKPVSSTVTTITDEKGNPAQVLDPGDPGFMIAKDLPAGSAVSGRTTSGSYDIDVSRVGMLGDVEDIRGLLQQGEYYLRVEQTFA